MAVTDLDPQSRSAELFDSAAELAAGEGAAWAPDEVTARTILGDYFRHVDQRELANRAPQDLVGMIDAHWRLASRRADGQTLLQVSHPSKQSEGWGTPTPIVQIVNDDMPFLVDSVSMEVVRQDWQLREILHPQFLVHRDADGNLRGLAGPDEADSRHTLGESWIQVEAQPGLGAGAEAYAELEQGLREVVRQVSVVVADWQPIIARLKETVEILQEEPVPYTFSQVRSAMELLSWLGDDRFTFLGYREYRLTGTGTDTQFEPVEGTGLGILREDDPPGTFHALPNTTKKPSLVLVTKDTRRSRMHRPTDLDYIGVRLFNDAGEVVGERRFLGLFASKVYTESVTTIPGLKDKVAEVLHHSGYSSTSHGWKAILATLESFPRDDLFQVRSEDLTAMVESISQLRERRQVRLFLRPDFYGRFVSCLVYLPRDRYITSVRLAIEHILMTRLGGESISYSARSTESVLARLHFVVRMPQGSTPPAVDVDAVEAELAHAVESWDDQFSELASGDSELTRLHSLAQALPEGYKADFAPRHAVMDILELTALEESGDMGLVLYVPNNSEDRADMRLKVFRRNAVMSLSDVLPHLSLLGVNVIDERPYELDLPTLGRGLVYDFGLRIPGGRGNLKAWTPAARQRFNEAFRASYLGFAEADGLTRLVTVAGLEWNEVNWLRLVSRYIHQSGASFSQDSVAETLLSQIEITKSLVELFRTKFDPAALDGAAPAERTDRLGELADQITEALGGVRTLDQDRIFRSFLAVINATTRTNAFRDDRQALAFKLDPQALPQLPEPRPAYEIFVCSPALEGVHLRFGHVARGGLRWSDRRDDFRTEVLGLVKAQLVKNTVIVPAGAKGGFYPKRLPEPAIDRAKWLEGGRERYRIFIDSMLDVTDNIVDGEIEPPMNVLRYDDDDPYLVVAADKGTATFSDTANEISVRRGYWLGDAFASGGSAGYDHKAMGITARGAWVSVQRHFRERGIDCQNEDFTCVGIGDMSGDVFGNGMLRSRHTKLIAAFNHQHVFLDPDPDPELSYAERQRLFDSRGGWGEYDTALISAGGGVFDRTAKSVPVGPEVRRVLGLDDDVTALTPNDLISAILRAPVDLLWNGGIGTYVKAAVETHVDAGDKANDGVRVDGGELRCEAVGEGGNLGFTQLGRIEYARNGGRINTDFIDNSAGVDTSDHEVNIKILLTPEVTAGRMTLDERNDLLASMTDEVAELVLAHNYDQNLALANSLLHSTASTGTHQRWIQQLEKLGVLDRALEFLPPAEELDERIEAGTGLTAPEMCTLLSYTKIWLEREILDSDLPDDPYLADRLVHYFPEPLRERFADLMPQHRLRREIITTVAVNRFVNSTGTTACFRLTAEVGARPPDVLRAQLAARAIFRIGHFEVMSRELDNKVDAIVQTRMRMALRNLTERATRWVLTARRAPIDIQATVEQFVEGARQFTGTLDETLVGRAAEDYRRRFDEYAGFGVPDDLARAVAGAPVAHEALEITQTAQNLGRDVDLVTCVQSNLAEMLRLDILLQKISALSRQDRWEALARSALRDDLQETQAALTAQALTAAPEASEPEAVLEAWQESVGGTEAVQETLAAVAEPEPDLARLSVGVRTVRSLLSSPK